MAKSLRFFFKRISQFWYCSPQNTSSLSTLIHFAMKKSLLSRGAIFPKAPFEEPLTRGAPFRGAPPRGPRPLKRISSVWGERETFAYGRRISYFFLHFFSLLGAYGGTHIVKFFAFFFRCGVSKDAEYLTYIIKVWCYFRVGKSDFVL